MFRVRAFSGNVIDSILLLHAEFLINYYVQYIITYYYYCLTLTQDLSQRRPIVNAKL